MGIFRGIESNVKTSLIFYEDILTLFISFQDESKLLIIGSWKSHENYSVLFNGVSRQARLISENVLKCFTPS